MKTPKQRFNIMDFLAGMIRRPEAAPDKADKDPNRPAYDFGHFHPTKKGPGRSRYLAEKHNREVAGRRHKAMVKDYYERHPKEKRS